MGREVTAGTPGEEFGDVEAGEIGGGLLDDQVVDHAQVGGGKAQLGEHEIDAIHPEGELILKFFEISVLETWPVADNEGAFAFMNILQRGQATGALPSPGVGG